MSRCSIILVHGTWGRGFFPKRRQVSLLPPSDRWWLEEGSQCHAGLVEALKSASLNWPIRAFLWSGANSIHARDCAARELSQQLRKDLQDPDATAVIIAHSHGGNVALRALQHHNSTGFGTLLLGMTLFVLPGVFKSFFFGQEFLFNGLICDIAVDSVPDTLGQVEAITLWPVGLEPEVSLFPERPFSLQGWRSWWAQMQAESKVHKSSLQLRHMIYNHPHCVDEIVRWLRRAT